MSNELSLSFGKTPISTFATYSRPISMMMRMLDKTMTKILVHKSCQLRHHSCFISRAERLPPSYIFLDESKPTNLQWPKTHQLWSLVLFTNSLLLVIINDANKINICIKIHVILRKIISVLREAKLLFLSYRFGRFKDQVAHED